jgi:hypothetical protein
VTCLLQMCAERRTSHGAHDPHGGRAVPYRNGTRERRARLCRK